jgi:exonuclease SbcD
MVRILHFADAHIDIANYGRRDPLSGLPLRVLDFLKALDTIVDTAIEERVDLVIFAGDAYKDRSPAPTFQREWGKRIMRLSRSGIRTILLVGNHDLSPALGRAHALQEYDTLEVANVHVIDRPTLLLPDQLGGLQIQIMALPWVSRSKLLASRKGDEDELPPVDQQIETTLSQIVEQWIERVDPKLPLVLTAHGTVQGAVYGGERSVMLGNDLILPGSMVRDPRLDYIALGHIHKAQNLNPGAHPPVIYPGSIERVDFGEAHDEKGFVIAQVARGKTELDQRRLTGRRFIDKSVDLGQKPDGREGGLPSSDELYERMVAALPPQNELRDAIVRLSISYPREWDSQIEDARLREYASESFDFHLVRRPHLETRLRLPENTAIASLAPMDLLDLYWKSIKMDSAEVENLNQLAREILSSPEAPGEE